MTSFANQWVWITGASAGLGEAMALAFARENANLILSARNTAKLQEVAEKCEGGGQKHILPLDLVEHDKLSDKVDQALALGGHIDILINNGGISQRASAVETIPEVT